MLAEEGVAKDHHAEAAARQPGIDALVQAVSDRQFVLVEPDTPAGRGECFGKRSCHVLLVLSGVRDEDVPFGRYVLGHEGDGTLATSMPDSPEEFMTVAEVAAILKLNQQTVRNWIDAGKLPADEGIPRLNL